MPFTTLVGGLELVIPTDGTINWGPTIKSGTWQKINDHTHTGGGDGNQLTSSSFAANSLDGSSLSKNLDLTQAATLTPAGTTETFNFDNGNIQVLDASSATGNITMTLSNPKQGAYYTMIVIQGGTPRTLIWPASVLFQGGADGEPTQFSSASKTNIIHAYYDGVNYLVMAWEIDL